MRLALLGFSHETNTFAPTPTDLEQFEASGIARGDEIVRRYAGSHSTVAGFLEASERFEFDLVPLIYAQTEPSGMITKRAFDRIVGEMLRLLEQQGPWDGVLLANHGAAVSEEFHDVDGE